MNNLQDTIVETKKTILDAMDTTSTITPEVIDIRDKYVFMEDTIEALDLAFGSNFEDRKRNIVLYGRGGNAKSSIIEDFYKNKGIKPFVLTMGQGMTIEKLFGGVDISHFIGENPTGKIEYLVENSFMNHEFVVFEELFDCPSEVLESLKDVLSSGILRQGGQIYPLKTRQIICATNRLRTDYAKDASIAALLERFPLEVKTEWKEYTSIQYSVLLSKRLGDADPLLVSILHEMNKKGKTISPRIALVAGELMQQCGPDCLRFIADFASEKEVLDEAMKNFKLSMELRRSEQDFKKLLIDYDTKFGDTNPEEIPSKELEIFIKEFTKVSEKVDKFKATDALLDMHTKLKRSITEVLMTTKRLLETTTTINTLDLNEDTIDSNSF